MLRYGWFLTLDIQSVICCFGSILYSMCCVCDEVGGEVKKEKLPKTKTMSIKFEFLWHLCLVETELLERLSHICYLLENVCVALQTQTTLFYYKLFVLQ